MADSPDGAAPTTITPRIPVVAVTGTNGKTTTSRMIAHIARTWGKHVGWSNTDGIYIDGVLVEAGDYSGPSGAGRVLAHEEVEIAVTETARGGILLKGIGLTRNDVSVVTNISADHLGLQGIDTLDQLAEVKAVVPHITRKSGWAVLNADDPRVFAMRQVIRAQPWVFSRDPDSPAVREILNHGGRATSVIDGWVCVLRAHADPLPLVELADVPMTLAGLSRFNVENALAAASAALAVGIPQEKVVEGLRTFRPDAEHNPGRMNFFSIGEISVVLDLAHNEAGLEAMVEIMNGVRRPGARIMLGLGAVGDRQDDLLERLGEIAGMNADVVAIGHKRALPARPQPAGARRPVPRGPGAGRHDRRGVVRHRGRVAGRPGRAGTARRRRRADVPRRAPGGLRLDRRARRHAGRPADPGGQGAGRPTRGQD